MVDVVRELVRPRIGLDLTRHPCKPIARFRELTGVGTTEVQDAGYGHSLWHHTELGIGQRSERRLAGSVYLKPLPLA